jgi:hypothetical protein
MAYIIGRVVWNTVSVPSGATARTVAGLKAPAAPQLIKILEFRSTHDGATSGNPPDITILERNTWATGTPGTFGSNTATIALKDPRNATPATTAATGWTAEPTVKAADEVLNIAVYNGSLCGEAA